MSTKSFECPLCQNYFTELEINPHVNSCLNANENNQGSAIVQSTYCSQDDIAPPPSKRHKSTIYDSKMGDLNLTQDSTQMVHSSKHESSNTSQKPKPALASIFQRKNKNQTSGMTPEKFESSQIKQSVSSSIKENMETGIKLDKTEPINTAAVSLPQNISRKTSNVPLAESMRPLSLEEYIGQDHVVGDNKMLRQLLNAVEIPSMIFWGPPGCGKTTLARIVASKCKQSSSSKFVQMSATTSGIADVKETIKVAKNDQKMFRKRTILFVDEIHRFNKLQQDTFLPHIEDGTIILIGATTENPSFQVNNALLSRCRVIVLEKLSVENVTTIINNALTKLGVAVLEDNSKDALEGLMGVSIMRSAVETLSGFCDGDARNALNALQTVYNSKKSHTNAVITVSDVKEAMQRTHVQYDRAGDEHYHCASALQKSIRGSDDNGAIYWMTRMLEGGEDPLFIARRLVVTASEDIGMADPQALPLAVATFQACQLIGRPECCINLAHCTTYLARAPKDNSAIEALHAAQKCIKEHRGPLPGVPLHLRNASTKLMKQMGYGKGYKYNHAYTEPVEQTYLPDELQGTDFYAKTKTK